MGLGRALAHDDVCGDRRPAVGSEDAPRARGCVNAYYEDQGAYGQRHAQRRGTPRARAGTARGVAAARCRGGSEREDERRDGSPGKT